MCWQITVLVFAIICVHMMPKESHYVYRGHCMPNSTVKWDPVPTRKKGMVFLEFSGNGTLFWNKQETNVDGHSFAHTYGQVPKVQYKSNSSPLKVTAHLIT